MGAGRMFLPSFVGETAVFWANILLNLITGVTQSEELSRGGNLSTFQKLTNLTSLTVQLTCFGRDAVSRDLHP